MTDTWQVTQEWLHRFDWSLWGVWTLTAVLLFTGVVSTVLPLLPGPLIIFVAGLLHKFLRPETGISWWGIVILGVLVLLSIVVDFMSGAVGTKWYGGSKWGIWGVVFGGIVGLFFGFIGIIIGPIIGGFLAERFIARKETRPAVRATWGSVVGTTLGMAVRLVISVVMVLAFLVDAFWW